MGNLVQKVKMIFAAYGIPEKIASDAGTNFTSEVFRVLQADEHSAVHNIILPPPEQWQSGGMQKICKMHS